MPSPLLFFLVFGKYLFIIRRVLQGRPSGRHEHIMETIAFPIPDAIRFYILRLGYSLQVEKYFEGSLSWLCVGKIALIGLKLMSAEEHDGNGKVEIRANTKVVGWVKTLCVHEEPSAAVKWRPPNQGRTTPRHRSRAVGRHQALPFPSCPALWLRRLHAIEICCLLAPGLCSGLTVPSFHRVTCMKGSHPLRPSSSVTSSGPILWLQGTLVLSLC